MSEPNDSQFPADVATRKRDYRRPRKKSKHRPGEEGMVAEMERRLENGEHLRRADDPPMESEDLVRVPVYSQRNIVGWYVVSEQDYRAEGRHEPHWGGRLEKAKRPRYSGSGTKARKRKAGCRQHGKAPAKPFPEDPARTALWNERQRLLADFKRRHGPADGEGEADDLELGRK